jgi:hypothetical protein
MATWTKIEIYNPKTRQWIKHASIAQAAKSIYFETKNLEHYLNGKTIKTPLNEFRFKVNGIEHNHKQARISYFKKAIEKYQKLLKKESRTK